MEEIMNIFFQKLSRPLEKRQTTPRLKTTGLKHGAGGKRTQR